MGPVSDVRLVSLGMKAGCKLAQTNVVRASVWQSRIRRPIRDEKDAATVSVLHVGVIPYPIHGLSARMNLLSNWIDSNDGPILSIVLGSPFHAYRHTLIAK